MAISNHSFTGETFESHAEGNNRGTHQSIHKTYGNSTPCETINISNHKASYQTMPHHTTKQEKSLRTFERFGPTNNESQTRGSMFERLSNKGLGTPT